jgi:PEP-CTERM motif
MVVLGLAGLFLVAPESKGASILVGQCVEFAACYTSGPTAWSSSLSLAQLTSLGLGSSVPLIAAETSQFDMRIGVTTFTFATSGGPVVETLGEFSSLSGHSDPCNLCEIDTIGTFLIPATANGSATISGFFGNSISATSAGTNICLGSGPGACAASSSVPEPGTSALVGAALIGLVFGRRKAASPNV